MRRFSSFFVLLAVGLGAAWGVCRFSTPCYESRCECEVSFGRPSEGGFEERLNTRLAAWQSELRDELAGVEVARVPMSHLVSVSARGERADEVAARANAAAEAIVAFTETTNVARDGAARAADGVVVEAAEDEAHAPVVARAVVGVQ